MHKTEVLLLSIRISCLENVDLKVNTHRKQSFVKYEKANTPLLPKGSEYMSREAVETTFKLIAASFRNVNKVLMLIFNVGRKCHIDSTCGNQYDLDFHRDFEQVLSNEE